MQNVIFTADDFGLTEAVNQAVELAHLNGVLTQTSLMVAAPAAQDAVARAHRMPKLKTGLHLVLVDGESMLGHAKLPNITDPDGRFPKDQVWLGVKYFFSPAARRELSTEIRAQFAGFAATGLTLHHADAHKHMQLHPTVAGLMIRIGKEFGLDRMRVPAEPPSVLRKCGARMSLADSALYAWSFVLRRQTRWAGLQSADHVFGIKWSGHMTLQRVQTLLQNLPPGSSEIYVHPAVSRDDTLKTLMPDYDHEAELHALLGLRRQGYPI